MYGIFCNFNAFYSFIPIYKSSIPNDVECSHDKFSYLTGRHIESFWMEEFCV